MLKKPSSAIKGAIFGEYGVGKTTLIHSLPEEETLVLDLEAGLLAVGDWKGRSEPIRQWEYARAWASLIGGADPSVVDDRPYGKAYHDNVSKKLGITRESLEPYKTVFIDSITIASQQCLNWVKKQPESYSKQGEFSNLKAYGMLGQEMIAWFTQLQHTPDKNIWFVGRIKKETDDNGNVHWEPEMEGSKAKSELPGIVDQVMTMTQLTSRDKEGIESKKRVFITNKLNKWGYPAKDRSGCLNDLEAPHLGKLMEKIRTAKRKDLNWSEILDDEILY